MRNGYMRNSLQKMIDLPEMKDIMRILFKAADAKPSSKDKDGMIEQLIMLVNYCGIKEILSAFKDLDFAIECYMQLDLGSLPDKINKDYLLTAIASMAPYEKIAPTVPVKPTKEKLPIEQCKEEKDLAPYVRHELSSWLIAKKITVKNLTKADLIKAVLAENNAPKKSCLEFEFGRQEDKPPASVEPPVPEKAKRRQVDKKQSVSPVEPGEFTWIEVNPAQKKERKASKRVVLSENEESATDGESDANQSAKPQEQVAMSSRRKIRAYCVDSSNEKDDQAGPNCVPHTPDSDLLNYQEEPCHACGTDTDEAIFFSSQ
eukprot:TRINITY_DN13141_c0_g1_i1.p2 TRINITY_DN13141_c0_g1~~TRINITY_DN13141_c0_g1_i1.p2  ORF type:complete len:317 (+),score=79.53 TRINITY_DN13141_c0_g1_i1:305-1255(+)